MAKKKSKKGSLPKRIAGVKVPKRVRRDLNGLLSSKLGRTIIADVLVAAGAAMVGTQAKQNSKTRQFLHDHPPGEAPAAVRDGAGAAASGSSALAFALGEASRSFIDALHRGKAMADARAAWPELKEDEPAPAKKKPGSGTETSPAH
ncbi:hypothetical protein [Phenylobacterium sp.]|jgi:hypothetical protein|uniref:hypothetical protein n=1 Tax=Phenylobacterium sp. TaxID=1871053 RepID=UPI002E367DAF|nr:hypothetical protein [Phenylobacterium sp.]HEX2561977.1 hypothetical protein [Phenylobacterium sp.]